MILITHILIAISSLIATAALYFFPSEIKLRLSYVAVGLTIATGFYLVLSMPAPLTETCITGLGYLALVSYGIVSGRNRIAREI